MKRVRLAGLRIDGERDLRGVPLYARLKQVLIDDGYAFRVGVPAKDWNRALLLNLGFWAPGAGGDVLVDERIPADVVAHVAWHHLAARALGAAGATADGMLLGESIASAFDLYLVGKLLVDAPRAPYLDSQVPAMAEVAQSAGLSGPRFAALLAQMAAHPEQAFADLRAMLFSVASRLTRVSGPDAAARVLAQHEQHRFHPLLHHYNVANWVLNARAHGAEGDAKPLARVERALRRSDGNALDWLARAWL